jgi:hypothetical protein
MGIFSTVQSAVYKAAPSTMFSNTSLLNPLNWMGYANGLVNKSILKPKGLKGINGFVFDLATEDSVQMSADITDHYTEDNMFVNDHVAIRPVRIIMKGFIGEVVYNTNPSGILGLFSTVQNALTTVPAYLGKYTPKGLQDIQKVLVKGTSLVNKVDNYISRAKNIVGLFDASTKLNNQQKAYDTLKQLFVNRVICSVETPFEYFDEKMIIESIAFRQGENDKYRMDIWVTLKEIRVATVSVTPVNKVTTGGRALFQRQSLLDNGPSKGTPIAWASKFTTGMKIKK